MQVFFLMLGAVGLYIFYPLAVVEGQIAGLSPVDQLFGIYIFALISSLFLFAIRVPTRNEASRVIRELRSLFHSPLFVFLLIASPICNLASFALLVFALQGDEKIQAAVLYELWPAIFIILTSFYRKADEGGFRFTNNKLISSGYFIVGIMGLVLVSSGNQSNLEAMIGGNFFSFKSTVILGLSAAILMALESFFATERSRMLMKRMDTQGIDKDALGILASQFNTPFGRAVSLVALFIISIVFRDLPDLATITSVPIEFAIPGLIAGLGGALFIAANNTSKVSNITFLWYFVPLFAAGTLFVAGHQPNADGIIFIGAIYIVIVNFGLNSQVDLGISFQVALFGLSFIGLIVYFVPGLGFESHFEATGIVMAFFSIQVAFLLDRQNKRRDEYAELWSDLVVLLQTRPNEKVSEFARLATRPTSGPRFYSAAYGLVCELESKDTEMMKNILRIARNRDSQVRFGEAFSLFMLLFSTLLIAIVGRPEGSILADFLAIIITTSSIFLALSVICFDEMHLGSIEQTMLNMRPEPGILAVETRVFGNITGLMISAALTMVLFCFCFLSLLIKHGFL